jgi:hypothetical protein
MSEMPVGKSWTVDVDGAEKRITVETDPEHGRTQIRIDGRMAARPMSPEDMERKFTIGSVGYVVRRDENGELDLDIDPDVVPAIAPPAYKMPPPKESSSGISGWKIVGGIVAVLLIPVVRYGVDLVRYMNVPWQVHDAPDHKWRVSFPTRPEESSEMVPAGGRSLRTVKLQSRYHNHMYVLEWIELPVYPTPEQEASLVNGALDGMVKGEGATLVKNEWSSIAHHSSMHFILQMPKNKDWSGGTARGHIVRSGRRLYIIYAYVPRREALSYDVGEYLRSFDLPDD